jgi:hypothetical protein
MSGLMSLVSSSEVSSGKTRPPVKGSILAIYGLQQDAPKTAKAYIVFPNDTALQAQVRPTTLL